MNRLEMWKHVVFSAILYLIALVMGIHPIFALIIGMATSSIVEIYLILSSKEEV